MDTEKYQKDIGKLQNNVSQLSKVFEKQSGISPDMLPNDPKPLALTLGLILVIIILGVAGITYWALH